MRRWIRFFIQDTCGATALEYGFIAAFIGLAVVAIVTGIGGELRTPFEFLTTTFVNAS